MTDVTCLAEIETNLHKHIKAAHEKAHNPLQPDDIADIVREVISSMSGDVTASDLKLYAELEGLANYIRHAKLEIAAIKPKDISSTHIPNATDELDAVVGATEDATNKIMDVCDRISAIAGECSPEVSQKLIDCTTNIFEACNFQDITGQRITKVVATLKTIEIKVAHIIATFSDRCRGGGPESLLQAPPAEELLHGPQLPANAMDQTDIDKLLASFD